MNNHKQAIVKKSTVFTQASFRVFGTSFSVSGKTTQIIVWKQISHKCSYIWTEY